MSDPVVLAYIAIGLLVFLASVIHFMRSGYLDIGDASLSIFLGVFWIFLVPLIGISLLFERFHATTIWSRNEKP